MVGGDICGRNAARAGVVAWNTTVMCVPARTHRVEEGDRSTKIPVEDSVVGRNSIQATRGPKVGPGTGMEFRSNDISAVR